ncbi:MAG: acetyl-CoA carboxylase biotin carboxyl carrier protein [Pyrinomonadaceae bacterium]
MSETTASMKAEESEKSKGKTAKKESGPDRSYDIEEIRDLADLFEERALTEFEFENENIRIRLSKMTSAPAAQAYQPTAVSAPAIPQVSATHQETAPPAEPDSDLFKITSPIVGTFYRASGPDKEPYVSEGSIVTADSVVCIVEAMKLMNEIQAETSGEVVAIYVENGQPVEFGQPLFGIKK